MVEDPSQLRNQLALMIRSRVEVWRLETIIWHSGHYFTSGYHNYAVREAMERYMDGVLHLEGTRWQPKDHYWGPEGKWVQGRKQGRW